jgi:hypothetical protein
MLGFLKANIMMWNLRLLLGLAKGGVNVAL